MQVDCVIGTAVNTGATLYSSTDTDGGTAELTIDDQGKYHLNIKKPVSLKKLLDTDGGVSGAKDAYNLTVTNAY